MKQTIIKCTCDNCNKVMAENEYENAIQVFIRVDVPNPQGGAPDCNTINMAICNKCAKEIGIVANEIHNGSIGTPGRIKAVLKKHKSDILKLFNKNKGEKDYE